MLALGYSYPGAASRPELLSSELIQAAMLRFLRPRRKQLRELQSPLHRLSRCPCRGTPYFSRNGARSFRRWLLATAALQTWSMWLWVVRVGGRNRISVSPITIWTTSIMCSVDYRTGKPGSNGLSTNTELTFRIRHSCWLWGTQSRRPTEMLP